MGGTPGGSIVYFSMGSCRGRRRVTALKGGGGKGVAKLSELTLSIRKNVIQVDKIVLTADWFGLAYARPSMKILQGH